MGMLSGKIELSGKRIVAHVVEATKGTRGVAPAYEAPSLHVVGKAVQLVQGRSVSGTWQDGRYFYR
jgi:hypothetical protein